MDVRGYIVANTICIWQTMGSIYYMNKTKLVVCVYES